MSAHQGLGKPVASLSLSQIANIKKVNRYAFHVPALYGSFVQGPIYCPTPLCGERVPCQAVCCCHCCIHHATFEGPAHSVGNRYYNLGVGLHIILGVCLSVPPTTSLGLLQRALYQTGKCWITKPSKNQNLSPMLQTAFWSFFEIMNIVTDVVLMLFPGKIVFRIQARKIRKVKAMLVFALRVV